MTHIAITEILAAAMLVAAPPAIAAPHRTDTRTATYRASYDQRRDVYCIRFYADPPPADPRPGPSIDPCQSRAAWAREGVRISHSPGRPAQTLASRFIR